MSVKLPLQSIFSHLYPSTEPELPADEPPAPAADAAAAGDDEGAAADAGGDAPPAEAPEAGEEGDAAAPAPVPAPAEPDEYQERITTIDSGLQKALDESRDAAEHLVTARQLAMTAEISRSKQLDLEYGLEQRKTGVPLGASLLDLEPTVLDTHGLLDAHELLLQVQRAQAARSSSDQGGGRDLIAEEAASRPPPHYQLLTAGFESRLNQKSALIASVKSVRALAQAHRAQELAALEAAGKAPPKVDEEARALARAKADATMPMEQQELELKVMKRLQGPLNFMRNPRYVLPPRKPAELAAPEPPSVPRRDAWIHCNPEKVNFVAYDAGGVYEIPVQLHNTSHLSRRVRVLPPSTRYFSVTLVSYPAEHGTIAPGMHATFHVRFAPDSLADYDDFLVVQTEAESFPLPLHARRSPPCLTLPAVLQCGNAFAGGATSVDFGAQNTGGAGRFFVIEKSRWEAGERDVQPVLHIGPFELTPTFLDLQPMDYFSMSVTFRPEEAGTFTADLVLVCDNCQLKELSLAGSGCVVVVNIESVDGQPPLFATGGVAAQESVDFAEVNVLTEQKSVVRLTNTTPLPLQFEWLRYELPPSMLPLTRQRTAAMEPLSSGALGDPLSVGDGAADSSDAAMVERLCPFTISPAQGHLAAGEASTFEVTFRPLDAILYGGAALLRPIGVPEAALPGYDADPTDADDAPTLEIGLRLLGRGSGWDLKLWPPSLALLGGTTIGCARTHTIKLTNPNDAPRTWAWQPDAREASQPLQVSLDPPGGELGAGESCDVEVTMVGRALGRQRRSVRLHVSPHGRVLVLPLELAVAGPELHIATPKLDYGLCPLGDEHPKVLTLTFSNPTEADAKWMLCPAPLPRSDPTIAAAGDAAARAQAGALGLPFPPPPPRADRGWDWAEQSRAQTSLQASLLVEHGASGLRPSQCCGVLRAKGTAEVEVTMDAAAEQSLRRMLELRVQHGVPSHVAVRAEVVARAASLLPASFALGTTYVRVPVSRTLTLTNLTRIATTFDCVHHVRQGRASVEIDPPSGVLQPAEVLKLVVTVTAEVDGPLDLLVGAVLHGGTAKPVGCSIGATVQGLTVSYEAVAQNDPKLDDLPKALPPPADVVDANGVAIARPPPDVPPTPTIDFGRDVPIFEQRSVVLLVTNLSAVRTRFSLTPKRYPAAALPVELQEPPVPEDYTETATALAHLKQADVKIRKEAEAEARRARLSGGSAWQIEQAEKAAYEKRGLKPPPPGGPPPSTAASADGGGGDTRRASLTSGGGETRRMSTAGSGAPPPTGASTRSRRPSIPISFHRPILSNAHEQLQRFSSGNGVTYSAQRQLRKREEHLLKEGHGACFEISPAEGILEPWGVVAVTCSVHSCMWGMYDDILVADVLGLEPVEIPMHAGVVGSPLIIHDATLGLSNITSPPTLGWAPVPIGSAPQNKTIRVLNKGPKPAQLQWSLLRAADPSRALAATLAPSAGAAAAAPEEEEGEGGSSAAATTQPLALSLGVAPTDPLDDGSFVVEPPGAMIPAGGEKWFNVAFVGAPPSGDDEGDEGRPFQALLKASLTHPTSVALPTGGESNQHPPLRVQLKAHSLEPRLQMSERSKLKFKVSPTMPKEHPAYTRALTMTNAMKATLEFTLEVPHPFILAETRSSVAQQRILGRETVDEGSVFVLPPDSSLQCFVTYVPPKRRKRAADGAANGEPGSPGGTSVADLDDAKSTVSAAQTATSDAGTNDPDTDPHITHVAKAEKALTITFANGSVQRFPLLAVTTTPFLELSPPLVHGTPSLAFGVSHTSETPERDIELWNPTEAEAAWTIVHQPYKPPPAASAAGARAKAAMLAGETLPTDDPDVFVFEKYSGLIPAKNGHIPVHYPLKVQFVPKQAGRYRCTFSIKVKAGMTAKLEVSAEASLREEDISVVHPDKHLRLMQDGEVS